MRVQLNRPKRYKTKNRNFVNIIKNGEFKKFYKSKQWRDMRLQALQRDKFECQRCNGSFGSNDEVKLTTATEVHHIKPIKEFPELCLALSNLVSLCHRCHDIIEGRFTVYPVRKQKLTEEKW